MPKRDQDAVRRKRRAVNEVKVGLRDLRIELSVLNHRVGTNLELKDIDFDCLDVVVRHGPLSPTALARRAGVHLATMTGILNRLEAGGWVVRERADSDRRGVVVRNVAERQREVIALFGPMNSAIDEICADYSESDLAVVQEFLRRTTEAGRAAADGLGQ